MKKNCLNVSSFVFTVRFVRVVSQLSLLYCFVFHPDYILCGFYSNYLALDFLPIASLETIERQARNMVSINSLICLR